MKNIALISHSPAMAGAERMLVNLAVSLKANSSYHPIVLIPMTGNDASAMATFLDRHGVEWRELPTFRWYIYEDGTQLHSYARSVKKRTSQVAQALRDVCADVAIVNTLTSLEGVMGCFEADIPFLLWAHGIIDASLAGTNPFIRNVFDKFAMELASKVVTCSRWTADFFRQLIPHKPIETIHNWTNISIDLQTQPDRNRFCVLSTLEPHKGFDTVVKAVALLRDEGFPVVVDAYCGGHGAPEIKTLVQGLGVEEFICFQERVADVAAVYKKHTATLAPSLVESFGMVAIESMAVGTPVIAAAAGGLKEIIEDGVNGQLFAPGDAKGLASAMRRIATDDAYRAALSAGGIKRVGEKFNGAASVARFVEALDEIVATFQTYDSRARDRIELFDLLINGHDFAGSSDDISTAFDVVPQAGVFRMVQDQKTEKFFPFGLAYGSDLRTPPYRSFHATAPADLLWGGIDLMLMPMEPQPKGMLVTEIVVNDKIARNISTDLDYPQRFGMTRILWKPLKLKQNDAVEFRLVARNANVPIRILEWRRFVRASRPYCSLIIGDHSPGVLHWAKW